MEAPTGGPTATPTSGNVTRRSKQLGDLLVEEGKLTAAQLETAETEQRRVGRSLGRVLVDLGMLSEGELLATLARQVGMRFVDLAAVTLDPTAAAKLPEAMARRHLALPIGYEDGRLLVAMADPGNVVAVDDIRAVTGADIRPVVATRSDIVASLDRLHRRLDEVDELAASAAGDADDDELADVREVVEDAPIVKLVNLLISQAVQDRASDIHIEPQERELRIRYRIDGVLHEVMRPPKTIQAGVTSRLKIMADMDIAERRVPQDGRIAVTIGGRSIDLRVASLPTVYGEKLVMRILDKSSVLLSLADLGFTEGNYERFEAGFRRPHGLVLVTGPTGSGKSTTLYATLNMVNDAERNIITVEDPVEYRLKGINQVQVNTKAGLSFAAALRSILRCDPDVVLIGEIRDRETAQIASEAALTGHLVLATLHTNDAPSAISRLVEMGVEPFLVASAAECVLAQRLLRKLCDKCREPDEIGVAALVAAGYDEAEAGPAAPYRAVGCPACGRTGYKGRIALHEVMTVTEQIERLAVEHASSEAIARVAREQGMRPLRHDGLGKAASGITTLEEVLRVVV
jgi:type IV pilus assembly protein PilB